MADPPAMMAAVVGQRSTTFSSPLTVRGSATPSPELLTWMDGAKASLPLGVNNNASPSFPPPELIVTLQAQLSSLQQTNARVVSERDSASALTASLLRKLEEATATAARQQLTVLTQADWAKERDVLLSQLDAVSASASASVVEEYEGRMSALQVSHMEALMQLADLAQREADDSAAALEAAAAQHASALAAKEAQADELRLTIADLRTSNAKLAGQLASTSAHSGRAIADLQVLVQEEERDSTARFRLLKEQGEARVRAARQEALAHQAAHAETAAAAAVGADEERREVLRHLAHVQEQLTMVAADRDGLRDALARSRLDIATLHSNVADLIAVGEELRGEMTAQAGEHKAARVAHATDLAAAAAHLAQTVADVEARGRQAAEAHGREVSRLRDAHRKEVEGLKDAHSVAVEGMAAEHRADLDAASARTRRMIESHEASLTSLQEVHEMEVRALKSAGERAGQEHASTLAVLMAEQGVALAAVEAEYAATFRAMREYSEKGAADTAAIQAQAVVEVSQGHDRALHDTRVALKRREDARLAEIAELKREYAALDVRRLRELQELSQAFQESATAADETAARVVAEMEILHARALTGAEEHFKRQYAQQAMDHATTINTLKASFEGVTAANGATIKSAYEQQVALMVSRVEESGRVILGLQSQLDAFKEQLARVHADAKGERDALLDLTSNQDRLLAQLRAEHASSIASLIAQHETGIREALGAKAARETEMEGEQYEVMEDAHAAHAGQVLELKCHIAELTALFDRAAADHASEMQGLQAVVGQQVAALRARAAAELVESEARASAVVAAVAAESAAREGTLLHAHERSEAVARRAAEHAIGEAESDRDCVVRGVREEYGALLADLRSRHEAVVSALTAAHSFELSELRRDAEGLRAQVARAEGRVEAAEGDVAKASSAAALEATYEARHSALTEKISRYESVIVEIRGQLGEARAAAATAAARATAEREASAAKQDSLLSELAASRQSHVAAEAALRASHAEQLGLLRLQLDGASRLAASIGDTAVLERDALRGSHEVDMARLRASHEEALSLLANSSDKRVHDLHAALAARGAQAEAGLETEAGRRRQAVRELEASAAALQDALRAQVTLLQAQLGEQRAAAARDVAAANAARDGASAEAVEQRREALAQIRETHEKALAQAMQSMVIAEARVRADAAAERSAAATQHTEALSVVKAEVSALQATLEGKSAELGALLSMLHAKDGEVRRLTLDHATEVQALVDAHHAAVLNLEHAAVSREEAVEEEAHVRELALQAVLEGEKAELRGSLAEVHAFLDRAAADSSAAVEGLREELTVAVAALRRVTEGKMREIEAVADVRQASVLSEVASREGAVLSSSTSREAALLDTLARTTAATQREGEVREALLREQYESMVKSATARQEEALTRLTAGQSAEVASLLAVHVGEVGALRGTVATLQASLVSLQASYEESSRASVGGARAEADGRLQEASERLAAVERQLVDAREALATARDEARDARVLLANTRAAGEAQVGTVREGLEERLRDAEHAWSERCTRLSNELAEARVVSAQALSDAVSRHARETISLQAEVDALRAAITTTQTAHDVTLAQLRASSEAAAADARRLHAESLSALALARESAVREAQDAARAAVAQLQVAHTAELLAVKKGVEVEEVRALARAEAKNSALHLQVAELQVARSSPPATAPASSSPPPADSSALVLLLAEQHAAALQEECARGRERERRAEDAGAKAVGDVLASATAREAQASASHGAAVHELRGRLVEIEGQCRTTRLEASKALAAAQEGHAAALAAVRASHESACAALRATHQRSLAQALQAALSASKVGAGGSTEERSVESTAFLALKQAEAAVYSARVSELEASHAGVVEGLQARVAELASALTQAHAQHADDVACIVERQHGAVTWGGVTTPVAEAPPPATPVHTFAHASSALSALETRLRQERAAMHDAHAQELTRLQEELQRARSAAAKAQGETQRLQAATAGAAAVTAVHVAPALDGRSERERSVALASLQSRVQDLEGCVRRGEADAAAALNAARASHAAEVGQLRDAIGRLAALRTSAAVPSASAEGMSRGGGGQVEDAWCALAETVTRLAAAYADSATLRHELTHTHARAVADLAGQLREAVERREGVKAEGRAALRSAIASERAAAAARDEELSRGWSGRVGALEARLVSAAAAHAEEVAALRAAHAQQVMDLQTTASVQVKDLTDRLVSLDAARATEFHAASLASTAAVEHVRATLEAQVKALQERLVGGEVVKATAAVQAAIDAAVAAALSRKDAALSAVSAEVERARAGASVGGDVGVTGHGAEGAAHALALRAAVAEARAEGASALASALEAMSARLTRAVVGAEGEAAVAARKWSLLLGQVQEREQALAASLLVSAGAERDAALARLTASYDRQAALAGSALRDAQAVHASALAAVQAGHAAQLAELRGSASPPPPSSSATGVTPQAAALLSAELGRLRVELASCEAALAGAKASLACHQAEATARGAVVEERGAARLERTLAALRAALLPSATLPPDGDGAAPALHAQRLAVVQAECDRLSAAAQDAAALLAAAQNDVSTLHARHAALATDLAVATERHALALQAALSEGLSGRAEEREAATSELVDATSVLQGSLTTALAASSAAQAELDVLQVRLSTALRATGEAEALTRASADAFQASGTELQRKLAAAATDKAAVEHELARALGRVGALEARLEAEAAQRAASGAAATALDLAAARAAAEAHRAEAERAQARVQELEAALAAAGGAATAAAEASTAALSELRARLAEDAAALDEAHAEVAHLHDALMSKNNELRGLQVGLQNARRALSDSRHMIGALQAMRIARAVEGGGSEGGAGDGAAPAEVTEVEVAESAPAADADEPTQSG